ncbi:hypothetical protein DPMN_024617 [Dreissena polymorpha]|uniref:Uncharacterized protein n=1 Tax=Dreissena polymorpha TaxID=45954 RepID=A0A9D4LN95_DREPO|nr:hypothetical protein DPMN_024617 [Dreissena polymorpha]
MPFQLQFRPEGSPLGVGTCFWGLVHLGSHSRRQPGAGSTCMLLLIAERGANVGPT